MELMDNKVLFSTYAGAIELAYKVPTYDCVIGQLRELKRYAGLLPDDPTGRVCVPDVAFLDDKNNVLVRTQENPEGELYSQDAYLVVRPVPVSEKSRRKGIKVDAYVKSGEDLANETEVSLGEAIRSGEQARLMGATIPYVRKVMRADGAERKAIILSDNMIKSQELIDAGVSDGKRIKVCNEWGGEPCDATSGDAVIVTDFDAGKGYRIDKVSFFATHALENCKKMDN